MPGCPGLSSSGHPTGVCTGSRNTVNGSWGAHQGPVGGVQQASGRTHRRPWSVASPRLWWDAVRRESSSMLGRWGSGQSAQRGGDFLPVIAPCRPSPCLDPGAAAGHPAGHQQQFSGTGSGLLLGSSCLSEKVCSFLLSWGPRGHSHLKGCQPTPAPGWAAPHVGR